jgi:Tn3 transposase DDE domain
MEHEAQPHQGDQPQLVENEIGDHGKTPPAGGERGSILPDFHAAELAAGWRDTTLQVIENWNSANSFIVYGRGGEIASNRQEDQELALLALHLLQIAMVYINTLMIQQVLTDETWWARMTPDDLRALTPLMYAHVTPYGAFKLDMQERIPLEAA